MDVRLEWLEIKKFRHVKPCRLSFNAGHNVLLGLNATGKTTLLELLAMVVNGQFATLKNEEFALGFGLVIGGVSIAASLSNAREAPERNPLAELLGGGRMNRSWTLQLKAGEWTRAHQWGPDMDPSTRPGQPPLDGETPFDGFWYALAAFNEREPPTLEVAAAVNRVLRHALNACTRFDESLIYFLSLWDRESPFAPTFSHGGPVRRRLPPEFADAADKHPPSVDDITLKGAELPRFAGRVKELTGMDVDVELLFHGSEGDTSRYKALRFRFTDGRLRFLQDALSYGQKRLIAFLCYAGTSDVIVADELVNGLHHSLIDACVKEIGDRQSFLTSQNALLLDYLELRSPEEAQKMFIVCRRDGDQLSWENITMEQAKDIFAAREVGIQQLSEILLARGLW